MRRNRNGSMLIQQIVLMSSAGAILMSGASILHKGFNFATEHRKQHLETLNTRRLALQFRQDIHASTDILKSNANTIELRQLDQKVVRYVIDRSSVQRLVLPTNSDAQEATEQFAIPLNCQASFQAEDRSCTLTIRGKASPTDSEYSKVHLVVTGLLLPEMQVTVARDAADEEETSNGE